jgi:hypothetical protein
MRAAAPDHPAQGLRILERRVRARMENGEIVRMAAFKLRDCARRMASLALECTTPPARQRLRMVAAELARTEQQVRALLDARAAGFAATRRGAA